jgi:hypothetical protein
VVVLICKLSFIIHRDGPDGESSMANTVSAASWITSRDIGRSLEGVVKETFPNFGPELPETEDENEILLVSEILAGIVKGFESGYSKEKVLHYYP